MRMDVNAVLLQYFEQTAPPQTCAEAVLLAAAEALRTLLGAEEVRFVVRLGTLLKELTFPGQITRARTENEDDMILACLAHCAGKVSTGSTKTADRYCSCLRLCAERRQGGKLAVSTSGGGRRGTRRCFVQRIGNPGGCGSGRSRAPDAKSCTASAGAVPGERDGRDKRDFCFRMGTGGHAVS